MFPRFLDQKDENRKDQKNNNQTEEFFVEESKTQKGLGEKTQADGEKGEFAKNLQERQTSVEKILEAMRKKDSETGVSFEDISAACQEESSSNVERIIRRLVEAGDVFEIRAGRYKILE